MLTSFKIPIYAYLNGKMLARTAILTAVIENRWVLKIAFIHILFMHLNNAWNILSSNGSLPVSQNIVSLLAIFGQGSFHMDSEKLTYFIRDVFDQYKWLMKSAWNFCWSFWFDQNLKLCRLNDFMICEFAVFTVQADLNIHCKTWSYFKFLNDNDGFFY